MSEKRPLGEIVAAQPPSVRPPEQGADTNRQVVAVPASEIAIERTDWLWQGRVPLGEVTLLAGLPGLGKSMLTVWLAAQNSLGRLQGEPGATLIATAEDSPERTVVPRLKAWEANLSLVRFLHIRDGDEDGLLESVGLPKDTEAIRQVAGQVGATLLVVDPLMAHLDVAVDSYRDQAVRQALNPLYYMARDLGAAVVTLLHLNKNPGSDPLMRIGGSVGLPAAARSTLLLARDPDDPDGDQRSQRILAHVKCNVGPLAPSLLFEIEPIVLLATGTEPEVETARIEERGVSDLSGSDLLGRPPATAGTKAEEAERFLLQELAEGARSNEEVKAAADAAGISEKTLRRAREKLRVETLREGFPATTVWRLRNPDGPHDRAHATAVPKTGGHDRPAGEGGHDRRSPLGATAVPNRAPVGTTAAVPLSQAWAQPSLWDERAHEPEEGTTVGTAVPDALSPEEAAVVARHPELFSPEWPLAQVRDFVATVLATEAREAEGPAA